MALHSLKINCSGSLKKLIFLPDDGNDVFERLDGAEEDAGEGGEIVWPVGRRSHLRVEELLEDEQHFRRPVVAVSLVGLDLQVQRLKANRSNVRQEMESSILSRLG